MDRYPPDHEVLAIAFRRLVYKFSLKLSKEECRALVYIRLYDCKERYRDADTLEVLSRLETDCVFSPSNPEGLIDVAKDINRMDLKDMVKDFVKRKREKASSKTADKTATRFESEPALSDEQLLQLKAILEVTLSQAAVFVQQVDILQQAIVAGTKEQRQKAAGAIRDAGRTAQALTKRLQDAQGELENSDSSRSGSENDYYNLKYGSPPDAGITTTGIGAVLPRQVHVIVPSQESQFKPAQVSTEEVCPKTQSLMGSLNMAELSHVRQQGSPLVEHQGILFSNTRRWTTSIETERRAKPAVLPKPTTMPKTSTGNTKLGLHSEVDPHYRCRTSGPPTVSRKPTVPRKLKASNSMQQTEGGSSEGICDEPALKPAQEFATPDQFQTEDEPKDGTGDSGFGDLKAPLYPKVHPYTPLSEDTIERVEDVIYYTDVVYNCAEDRHTSHKNTKNQDPVYVNFPRQSSS